MNIECYAIYKSLFWLKIELKTNEVLCIRYDRLVLSLHFWYASKFIIYIGTVIAGINPQIICHHILILKLSYMCVYP